jgi:hypothetical protein
MKTQWEHCQESPEAAFGCFQDPKNWDIVQQIESSGLAVNLPRQENS